MRWHRTRKFIFDPASDITVNELARIVASLHINGKPLYMTVKDGEDPPLADCARHFRETFDGS